MKNLVSLFIFFLLTLSISAQSADSLFMKKTFLWDKSSLPVRSGVKYNDVWGWTDTDGTEYAILGNVDSIFFINVTDPYNPITVDSFYGGGRSLWRDFKSYNNHVYMSADENSEGLTIFDMSTLPDSVRWVGQNTDHFLRAHNIFIDTVSGRLYALGTNSGAAREGLVVLDLTTDPENPDSLSYVALDSIRNGQMTSDNYYIHDAFVRNDTVYASHGNLGYLIWDCTDLNDIKLIASFEDDNPGYNHSSWNNDANTHAVFVCEVPSGLPVYILPLENFSSSSPPQLDTLMTFKDPLEAPTATNSTPHNPFVKNDTLYISYYEDGVQIYDMTDVNDIYRIAYYDTDTANTSYNGTENNWGVYPFFNSGNIIASDTEFGMFILQIDESIVPVEFIDITATIKNQNAVEITWKTASEINNEAFEIEKSTDGLDFYTIAELPSFGNNSTINTYNYVDSNPFEGVNYYRVKQRDYNGKTSYSPIVQASLKMNFKFNIYPNPLTVDKLSIRIDALGVVSLKVYDQLGRELYSNDYGNHGELASMVIHPKIAWNPGVYFIQISDNRSLNRTKKLVVPFHRP